MADNEKNIIYIRFLSKQGFPPGQWMKEPDLCQWYHAGYSCISIRDMSLGIWRSFVGVPESHPLHSKTIEDLLQIPLMMEAYIDVYGGIASLGKLPTKYKDESSNLWWLGIEASAGSDFMPLLQCQTSESTPISLSPKSYKDFAFIRRETNKLAKYISKVK